MFIHGGGFCTGWVDRSLAHSHTSDFVIPSERTIKRTDFCWEFWTKWMRLSFPLTIGLKLLRSFLEWFWHFAPNERLAPQYPHPYAVHDTTDHFHWIRENADKYNGDLNRFAGRETISVSVISVCWLFFSVFGESAGGNLATVISILSRDWKTEPPIKLQILHAPGLEIDVGKYPSHTFASKYFWIYFGWMDIIIENSEMANSDLLRSLWLDFIEIMEESTFTR